MIKLISDKVNIEGIDFNYIKDCKCLSSPQRMKKIATNNAKGSSYLEGINLPENFYVNCYDSGERVCR